MNSVERTPQIGLLMGITLLLSLAWPSSNGFGQKDESKLSDVDGFVFVGSSLADHPRLQARIDVLDSWIAHRLAERELPGLSIGIVHDQELVWTKGYGFADLEKGIPATPSTVYRIGSVSKVLTALAVMQLRDAGLLQLDDPVSEHLPWFQVKNPFPEARAITVRDLLTHTSGLPFDAPGVSWNEYAGPSREEIIARFPQVEPIFPAGEHVYYSNFGFWVAGEIVAALSGEPFDGYVDAHILEPLEMNATDLTPEPFTLRLAVGYRARSPGKARKPWPFTDTRFSTPAGDGASNVQDLARLLSFFMSEANGGPSPVIERSTLTEMQGGEEPGEDPRGLGLFVWRADDRLRVSHSGDGGGFVASIGFEPADELGVVVLTNSDDGKAWEFRDEALDIIAPGLNEAMESPEAIAAAAPELERYVGKFRGAGERIEFLLLDGQLTMLDPDTDDPWESKVRLVPEGPHTFRMMEVDDRYGERMRFELDGDGNVTAARFPSWYAVRESAARTAPPTPAVR